MIHYQVLMIHYEKYDQQVHIQIVNLLYHKQHVSATNGVP